MDTSVEKVYVNIPRSDLKFFKELVHKMGWEIPLPTTFLDKYIASRPTNLPLTDEDILDELKAVRTHTITV